MKRTLVTLLIFGLVAGSLAVPAEAGKKKKKKQSKRVVEVKYEAPAIGVGAPLGTGVCFRPTNSCGDIPVGADETLATVEITDATGLPVSFSLGQDTNPDELGTEKDLGEFCGKTEKPVKLEPGFPIIVFPWAVGPACASIATQGTVKATLITTR